MWSVVLFTESLNIAVLADAILAVMCIGMCACQRFSQESAGHEKGGMESRSVGTARTCTGRNRTTLEGSRLDGSEQFVTG